jgi:hypothetical protein
MRAAVLVAGGLTVGLLALAFILVGVDRATRPPASSVDATSPSQDTTPAIGVSPLPLESQRAPTSDGDDAAHSTARAPLPPLPDTDDPDVYAAAVAEVLFGMNYSSSDPGDYEAFFDAALWGEIAEDDRFRLLTTIGHRIPTPDMWEQMRSVQQTSEFEVELVWEPRTGRDHREAGDWPDGVVLRNVSGTQTETWHAPDEDILSSVRRVAVTVGVACPPASSPCRLLSIQPNVES